MQKSIHVKIIEWDDESQGEIFDISHLPLEFNFVLECKESASTEEIEEMAIDYILDEIGWGIINCKVSIT